MTVDCFISEDRKKNLLHEMIMLVKNNFMSMSCLLINISYFAVSIEVDKQD